MSHNAAETCSAAFKKKKVIYTHVEKGPHASQSLYSKKKTFFKVLSFTFLIIVCCVCEEQPIAMTQD